jgi:2-keto-4-pentenoate hydratase/2-oxohepta-3-ene-1,7-dioic acid hydratase in catechol pathway
MKISLRQINDNPVVCIAVGDVWYDAIQAGSYFLPNPHFAIDKLNRLSSKWTDNIFSVDGLWQYLKNVYGILKHTHNLPGKFLVDPKARYLPPILTPPLIFGLAGNCPTTWRNKEELIPNYPVGYVRPCSSLSSHNERIIIKPSITSFRCAVELGVVIGQRAKNVPISSAMDYVYAYTVVNDMISNHWKDFASQMNPIHNPSFYEMLVTSYYGRGSDGFCPIGPSLVSKDRISNPYNLLMWTKISGKTRDRTHTNAMIVGIEKTISYLSSILPLEPGSIVHMGTMGIDGVTIPLESKLGTQDYVELKIEKIGELRTYFDDRRCR